MNNQKMESALGFLTIKHAMICALVCALGGIMGCGDGASPSNSDKKEASENGELKLPLGDHETLDTLIASNAGKVVVVDFWATWCEPCVENLPHAIDFASEHKGQMTLITVSMDDPDDNEKALTLLKSKNAANPALQSESGLSQEAWEGFDLEDGTPWYRVYDREGNLVAESAEFSDLEQKIEELFAAN